MTSPPESRIVSTMRAPYIPLLIFLLLILIVFSSCPGAPQNTAVLCTNRPEFTAYAESFNTSQDEFRIIISYHDDPHRTINRERACEFDLIIDSYLNSRTYLDTFASLEGLFIDGSLESERFYPVIFQQGRYENQQVLLPISFNLPSVMFEAETKLGDADSFMLSLEQIAELSREFNARGEKGFTKLGLSLRWNPELLYMVSLLKNTNFRESETGTLLWDSRALQEAVDYTRFWTFELNGGLDAEREFQQKFMIEPPYMLISKKRILCYYRNLREFYSIPSQKRAGMKIRLLAENNRIPVLPGPLFAAIPHGAPGIRAAKAFLVWFLDPKNQEKLLAETQYKSLRTFGIAGGFSSLPEVNEQILPTYYPNLIGYIPGNEYLQFPEPLPPNWPLIKEEVLLPWLSEQAEHEEGGELMGSRLEAWLRQQP